MKTYRPFCDSDEYMVLAKLQSKDAVTKVVPVYNDLASSDDTHKPYEREGGYTWRVLTFKISDAYFAYRFTIDNTYLDYDEFWWLRYAHE